MLHCKKHVGPLRCPYEWSCETEALEKLDIVLKRDATLISLERTFGLFFHPSARTPSP